VEQATKLIKNFWAWLRVIIVVSSKGVVTAISEGYAVITAGTHDGYNTDTCGVTVLPAVTQPIRPTGVMLDITTLTLQPGAAETLKATVLSDSAGQKRAWLKVGSQKILPCFNL